MNLRLTRQLLIHLRNRCTGTFIGAARQFTTGFVSEALTTNEKIRLTIRLYNMFSDHRGGAIPPWGETLAPWEETWFRRRLPKPSAHILLGGCGAGREALALAKAGFSVDAFDLAPELVSLARRAVGNRARVLNFGYDELSLAVLEGAPGEASQFARERYDAAILGWGSLTHLIDHRQRSRLLHALDRICPKGPILASFWCTNGEAPETPTPGGADHYGRAIGRKIARLRGIRPENSCRESFRIHRGFGYTFVPEEIEELGVAISRHVVWEHDDTTYAHVTFLPVRLPHE